MVTHDSVFRIGRTHEVCQDYALSVQQESAGDDKERVVAMVSDGCSGEPHTDVGSRLILHGALHQWRQVRGALPLDGWIERRCVDVNYGVSVARAAVQVVGVDPMAVTATVVLVDYDQNFPSQVRGAVFGDGAITLRTPDGRLLVVEVMPPSTTYGSMPAYPTYDPVHIAHYLDRTAHVPSLVRVIQVDPYGRVDSVLDLDPSQEVHDHFGEDWDLRLVLGKVCERPWPRPTVALEAKGFDLATAWSDGCTTGSWLDKAGEWTSFHPHPPDGPAPLLYDLSRVARPTGRFLHRRAAQACRHWAHDDDLGGAAIYIGEDL